MAPALRNLLLAGLASGLSACLSPAYECPPPGTGDRGTDPATNPYAKPLWRNFGGNPTLDGRSSLAGPETAKHATFFDLGILKPTSECCHGVVLWPLVGADNTVYVLTSDRFLYAVNGRTGTIQWSFEGVAYRTPALGPNGTLYLMNTRDELVALDPAGGDVLWVARPGRTLSSINVAPDGTVVLATYEPMQLQAFDGVTGALKWMRADLIAGEATAIGDDGTIYIPNATRLYAVDGATGTLKWSTGGDDDLFGSNSSPAVADGRLYVAGRTPVWPDEDLEVLVHAFDAQTGALLWSTPVDSELLGTPAVGPDGTLYFGTFDGLYALDGKTGAVKWTIMRMLTTNRLSFAVGANGVLYVTDRSGTIYGLDGQTGEVKWRVGAHGQAGPAIGAGGTLYVGGVGGIYAIPPEASMLSGGGPLPEGPFY
ncbi:MAG: PQQ-binding-like beta-propeller repeat protein [Myxococcales bacterium]